MTGIEHEPSPLMLVLFLVVPVLAFWLFLELVKFIFNPKKYLKQLFCSHYYAESINDLWRLHDHKFTCLKCGKRIYTSVCNKPINKDF